MHCESEEEIRQPLHFGIEPATEEKGVSLYIYSVIIPILKWDREELMLHMHKNIQVLVYDICYIQ